MRRCILSIAVLVTVLWPWSAAAQNKHLPKPMSGKWEAMVSFTEGGGRFTASRADVTDVKQPDPNSIAFSIKQVTADHPMFEARLTSNPAGKNYLLTVKTDGAPTVVNVPLI